MIIIAGLNFKGGWWGVKIRLSDGFFFFFSRNYSSKFLFGFPIPLPSHTFVCYMHTCTSIQN